MIKTAYIRRFDGGMMNDPRFPSQSLNRVVSNFDILTDPYRMTPYRSAEDGDSSSSTSKKENFLIARRTGTTYSLYALGVKSGAFTAEVLYKDLTTGGSNDLDDATWATPSANQSTAGTTNTELFIYYKKTGLVYGARAGTNIWAFSPTGTAWADSSQGLSYTTVAQGCVHPADDILYIPYDNKIASNDNGSWNTTALTLPSHLYITSICPYKNFLAIFCAPLGGIGTSQCFLWNRDATLATVSETIDWGEGNVKVGEEINGDLVGISIAGSNTTRFNDRIIVKRYSGYGAEKIMEFVGTTGTQLPIAKQKINNRVYFMLLMTINGSIREGVFSVGRNPGMPYSFVHERGINNDNVSAADVIKNFFFVGDFLFQSYVNSSSIYAVTKTISTATYAHSSVYESEINASMDPGDRAQLKQLMSVGGLYEALASGEQVVLQYRIDGGSWIDVFTEDTDGVTFTEPVVKASDGAFGKGKDYEFRVVSTGGAKITGITYKYKVLTSNV